MAREITLLKDIEAPNGKAWAAHSHHIVSDEVAAHLVKENVAKYYNANAIIEAVVKLKTKTKK
jgi:hypothetical protein